MKSHRPQRATGHDKNHFIVRDFLAYACGGFEKRQLGNDTVYLANFHGYRVGAIDTSRLGGLWLDWLVFAEGKVALVEIKTPEAYAAKDNSIKEGEKWTIENVPMSNYVVSTDEQVVLLFEELINKDLD